MFCFIVKENSFLICSSVLLFLVSSVCLPQATLQRYVYPSIVVLKSSTVVDRGTDPRYGYTKGYTFVICFFPLSTQY